jgi:hypothetical protein
MVDPTTVGIDAAVEMLVVAARSLTTAGSGRFRR